MQISTYNIYDGKNIFKFWNYTPSDISDCMGYFYYLLKCMIVSKTLFWMQTNIAFTAYKLSFTPTKPAKIFCRYIFGPVVSTIVPLI